MKVSELLEEIYQDNYSHLEHIWNMGGECDCVTHQMIRVITNYWESNLKQERGA